MHVLSGAAQRFPLGFCSNIVPCMVDGSAGGAAGMLCQLMCPGVSLLHHRAADHCRCLVVVGWCVSICGGVYVESVLRRRRRLPHTWLLFSELFCCVGRFWVACFFCRGGSLCVCVSSSVWLVVSRLS